MEDGAAAWSGLGSSMNLPSAMREEIEQLKLELRDLKLEVAKDLMELKETVSSVIGDLVSFIDKQKSLLTRVEGLETRAQGAIPMGAHKDQFNAFAYVSLDELEPSEIIIEDFSEQEVNAPVEELQPVGSALVEKEGTNKDDDEVRMLSDEDLAAEFLEIVYAHIDEVGGVLNNVLFSKLWEREESPSSRVKKLVKDALIGDEDIDYHKLSKLRGLYFRTGGDPDGIYEQLYG